jgi:hypothetical protein
MHALSLIKTQHSNQQNALLLFIYIIYIPWILTRLEKPMDIEIVKTPKQVTMTT